jgi:hypothetical protein
LSPAKTLIAVVTIAAVLPAMALGQTSRTAVSCHAKFSHVPVHVSGAIAYKVVALKGSPSASALSCARGKAVIQAGFTKFGKQAANYRKVGKLHLVVSGGHYTLALPTPMASGSYAWTGAHTRVQYSLPTGD